MYLRPKTVPKNGKTYTYWRLVRSLRVGRRVVQKTVAELGELDDEGRARASALAEQFFGKRSNHPGLFEDRRRFEPLKVHLDRVQVERGRKFGDVWLGWQLWQVLRLDEFCEAHLSRGREKVPWPEMAAILVIARLCEPSSELHIAEDWYRKTALEDVLGVAAEQVHHTRLYQGLDQLLAVKAELEQHLKRRLGELFRLDYDLLLYDTTSTYFEGEALANPMAKRGHSRDKRPDCKQVCVGVVVDREGYPLGHEVFDGNRVDVTTVKEIVERMEERYGKAKRVWVMDRGMVSKANLEWLRAGGRQYVVTTPRSEIRKWDRDIAEAGGWESVREGLDVKICRDPGGDEVFVLCRSSDRRQKEAAMHERFGKRIVEGLESLGRRLDHARRPIDRGSVERQIGRLLQRNSRAAAKFAVRVTEDASRLCGLKVVWSERPEWTDSASRNEGVYVLRSNVVDWTGEQLWRTYTQLYEVEAAFRIHKSELRIRPIWHQRKDRVRAHILVCFLAYVLWKTLQGWQQRAHLGSSPRTVLDELAQITTVDVVLPLENDSTMRLRCVVKPEPATAAILDRLGLELPQRLRAPEGVKM
jgi:transposase